MGLPFVAVLDQLLLVVKKFLVKECRVLVVGAFNDGINRAGLLAEATEDALRHVDVVLGSATRSIWAGLRLDDDGKGRARSLAELASDAALLTRRVATKGVLTTEHGGERSFLPRVVEHMIRLEGGVTGEPNDRPD